MKMRAMMFGAVMIAAMLMPMRVAAQNAPANVVYAVSPGDQLDVTFRFTPEFNQSVTVQPDGHITLLSTGDLNVLGSTIPQVQAQILAKVAGKLVDPEIAVTLQDSEHNHYAVAGEVWSPGRYELRTATTALQAILLAGGQKEGGDMGHVYLFRKLNSEMSEVHELSFKRLGKGKPKRDMLLVPGDMILIPRDKIMRIGRYIKTFNLGVYYNPSNITLP